MTLPTPYYQSDRCTLYCGDCLDILPHLGKVDAVVTDPPFGIGNFVQTGGNVRGEAVEWNDAPPAPAVFEVLRSMSKHRIIWGANYFNCFEGAGALVWIKNQPMPNFSKAEIASVSWGAKVEMLSMTWTNFVNTKETDHPCERPVALYEWCCRQMPNDPRVILDPFVGSGSCGVAAIRQGRCFIGIERKEKYCAIAARRIKEAEEVGQMFREAKPQQLSLLGGAK